jgi:hypothetical protein
VRRRGGGGAESAGEVVEHDLGHVLCAAPGRGQQLRRAPPQPPMCSAPGPEARDVARRRLCRWTGTRRLSAASFPGCGEGLWPCGGDGGGWLFRVDGEDWGSQRKMGLCALSLTGGARVLEPYA